jgi:hypothetical protein
MSLYQASVLNKYLAAQSQGEIKAAFAKYEAYFLDKEIQQNIRNSKEEQFQQKFLMELFVNVLGYTMNPDANYNLTTELKNIKDAKKTDGAILKADGTALAVIELKGTDTKDLDKVNDQAFNYKNNHTDCIYVITSNFEKLRFFIHNAVEHEEFNLFFLSEERFSLLWLFLQKDNLLGGIPAKVKEESLLEEDRVTKELYKDYSSFKNDLWNNMVQNNPQHEPLLLYKKSQKLLDRFLFIFFAEDKGLLPPNSISVIIKQWEKLRELDEYKPLYDRLKKYFGYMNDGYKGKEYEIHAYNGGLFKEDPLLEGLLIDDELLKKHCLKLTNYDFDDEVDTNILGHIFEHSLNDIENVRAQLEGETIDKSKTKRKKDGVFYTPKYITKYIVDNTVGKLCEEKKAEIGIDDEEFAKERKGRRKETLIKLKDQLSIYREWLLQLTICDPACGSGAFLNQALEFLMAEHRYVDELETQLLGDGFAFPGVENHILENNIYGVDINEESVEIARLSLWLRTAQKGRKLTSLSTNIKCGNSLIDDPKVAGELAFNWKEQFPKVFVKGGFDVVIGNPPYVRAELLADFRKYFSIHFKVFDPASDLFAYFYELGTKLIKPENGIMGYISNTFDKTSAGQVLREYLVDKTTILDYVDFTEVQIFEGATTYPVIVLLNRNTSNNSQFPFTKIPKSSQEKVIDIEVHKSFNVLQKTLASSSWSFLSKESFILFNKLTKLDSVRDKYGKCYYGVKTALNDAFISQRNWPYNDHVKAIYEGKELKKWHSPLPQQKLLLFPSGWTKSTYGNEINEENAMKNLQRDFPELMKHLIPFEEKGKKRYDKGEYWWELRNCAYYHLFEEPKIAFPNLQNNNKFCLETKGVYINAPAVFLPVASKTLLCILNSKIVWEFLKSICVVRSGGYIEVKPQYFEQIPIPEFKNESVFDEKADEIISATESMQDVQTNFLKLLQTKFELPKLSTKFKNWPNLDFKGFLAELKKAKVPKLSLDDEAEWMTYFNKKKAEANALQTDIDRIDKEIDQMVYELYGLTDEEIKIVEDGVG